MPTTSLLIIYCSLILGSSLVGGWIPLMFKLTHKRMELAVSLVAGFMLGVGVLHLWPHALMELQDIHQVAIWLLAGFLTMFFLERFFSFHHHDAPVREDPAADGKSAGGAACEDHGEHGLHHEHELTWGGAAVGLVLHSLIAGIALAASVQTSSHAPYGHGIEGLSVFLLIVLHKPFDSLTLGTLMAAGGWSRSWRHSINVLFALAVPLGTVLFYLGAGATWEPSPVLIGAALAFSAGTFLCIAMSDLLPELQFHQHDRIKLSAAMLIGLSLSWAMSHFETGHQHENDQTPRVIQPHHPQPHPHPEAAEHPGPLGHEH